MKTSYSLLFFIFMITCSNFTKGNDGIENNNIIISKIHYKSNTYDIDTLRVFQNDTSVFKREKGLITRPCSNPESEVRYELIDPKDGEYYLIYNSKEQLVMEGKYTSEYTYEGKTYNQGNFYNSKRYSYKKNGNLETRHYMEDGRNLKTEYYNSKRLLTEIRYLDKKTEGMTKIEIYKNGQLNKTRIYTSFNKYTTVKVNK